MIKFILENFDTIFKNENSLETLNKIILDLAIKGKLVPQNENDEPAEELLKRIQAEKERLIKEKVIKKEKPLPEITEEEIPFDIPKNWEWTRLGNIFNIVSSKRVLQSDWKKSGIPFYRAREIAELSKNNNKINNELFISEELYENLRKFGIPKANDLMVTAVGTLGKTYIVKSNDKFYYKDASVICLENFSQINSKYFKIFMNSETMKTQIDSNSMGTTVGTLTISRMNNYICSLPPLEEQKRIVKKVEKLQEFIKNLKEIYSSDEKTRNSFKKSLLSEIEKSSDDMKLLNNLELVFNDFDKIVKTKEDIKDIRNLILSLATKGKLVPQNENDEPARELLKRIQAEKDKLIKEKVIKKEKPLPEITEDEIPFSIPKNWEWVRLGNILNTLTDGTHSTPKYTESGIPFLSVKNMSSGILDFKNTKFISKEEHEELSKRCKVEYGDLLLTKVETTGIPVIVDTEKEFSIFVSVALLKFNKDCLDIHYLKLLLNSPLVYEQSQENTKGVGNKNWVLKDIANTLIVIPPIEEQKRIVEKVKNLMEICNLLEEKINISKNISENLLKSFMNNGE